jgi:hypothetical protein
MMSKPLPLSTALQRKYLPTFADLVDRMSIVQLKMIFILENREAYAQELSDIQHDINLLLSQRTPVTGDNFAKMLHAVQVIMLANRVIWENEAKARLGGSEQDKLLKFTHSINGVRTQAKNVLAREMGERVDLKVDCLAADLPAEFGNWRIWE